MKFISKVTDTLDVKSSYVKDKVKVKLSLDRPIGVQEVDASRIYRQMAHEGGKVVVLRVGQLYPPRKIPGTHFC